MTPERLNEIQAHLTHAYTNADAWRTPLETATEDVWNLLEYIDLLHDDLRITRNERDAEKKKNMQAANDHATDARAKAWDEGYDAGRSDGWHDARPEDSATNPYLKDTK